jgi:hypothetical protein
MRLFICIWSIAMVAGLVPVVAQELTQAEAAPAVEASASLPSDWLPPGRVGQVSLVSGNVDFRVSNGSTWADAELNQPIFAGEALRTDARARGEVRIGANTIELSNGSEIEIASLRDRATQILLSRGRIGLHLRQAGENEAVEIDAPQGGVWLLASGTYDIEAGDGEGPLRVAVFDGTAHFAGAGVDKRIEAGQVAVLTASEVADAASIGPATADDFVAWCHDHDYDDTRLAAPYYVSRDITG